MHHKRFWSETYREFLQFRMTASAIKKVKALAGGIDEYLIRTPKDVLLYPKAIALKDHLIQIQRRRLASPDGPRPGEPSDYIAILPPHIGLGPRCG